MLTTVRSPAKGDAETGFLEKGDKAIAKQHRTVIAKMRKD